MISKPRRGYYRLGNIPAGMKKEIQERNRVLLQNEKPKVPKDTIPHKILVNKAKRILKNLGYRVFTEFYVTVDGRRYIVDVVGFKEEKSIAVECGSVDALKIRNLEQAFDTVKILKR